MSVKKPEKAKSPKNLAAKLPELVPQPHGGALLSGGKPNHRGAGGRPTQAFRDDLLGDLLQRRSVAAAIVDDKNVSPADRLRALDWMAKYSIGTVKEVSVDNVRDRVNKTLDVIQARTSAEQYALIVAELQPVWST